MDKLDNIYVAGHNGMVGAAICRELRRKNYRNLILVNHTDLSLDREDQVEKFFSENKIDYVFLAAAKVGGILANKTQGAEFIRDNLKIQTNVIEQSWRSGVRRLLTIQVHDALRHHLDFLGSLDELSILHSTPHL